MVKRFHVIGLQRTGTNWIRALINTNFNTEHVGDDTVFWKHLTPLGVNRHNPAIAYDPKSLDRVNDSDILFIATSKTLDLWKESIHRNKVDFYKTHQAKTDDRFKEVYDSWHQWKDQHVGQSNFYYHDYMDWLDHWEEYLAEIQEITGWTKSHEYPWFIQPKKVSQSGNFDIRNYRR